MSAISGIYRSSINEVHKQMANKLNHRGKGHFYWRNESATISLAGNTSSHSGFFTDGDMVLAVDGKIQNYSADDYLYPADIAALFNAKGEAFLQDLQGSFALLIADDNDNLLAARDNHGIKPLYWGRYKESLCFASEAKALSGLCQNIEAFPPGHCYYKGKLYRFHKLPQKPSPVETLDLPSTAEQIKDILFDAVAIHCNGAANMGVFLSGGLDSSILAALSCRQDTEVHTFTVGFSQSQDQFYAREVADYLGTHHHEYISDLTEIYEILPSVIYHLESFDVSLVRSAVANYLASQQAAESGVDIILMGEGADELFGGYNYLKNKNPVEQSLELNKLLAESHSMSLQRVDRMTSAYGLDVGLPFMDSRLIKLAEQIPINYKITADKTEKWILRTAFTGDLPENIIWRPKVEFSQGSGTADVLSQSIQSRISDSEFAAQKKISDKLILNSKEELYYYRIFHQYFPERELAENTCRWQPW